MDIPDCMTAEKIKITTLNDKYIGMLSKLILYGWPLTKTEVQKDLQPPWSFIDEITIIYNFVMKGRRLIIPTVLHDKVLEELHLNHMGIEKTRLLACESIYWINMNTDIEETSNIAPPALISKHHDEKIRQSYTKCWGGHGNI